MVISPAIALGLLSAISFGSGDFTGGYVTKKTNVFLVLLISQIVGLIFLIILLFLSNEIIIFDGLLFNLGSGIFGAIGLIIFYQGLSKGSVGVIAPVTAVIAPLIPLFFSLFQQTYSPVQIFGMFLALLAIWLVSYTKSEIKQIKSDLSYALGAGLCFGLFLLLINLGSSTESVFFPIILARIASTTLMIIIVSYLGVFERTSIKQTGLISLAGILDTLGNYFFILSSKAGRVDFASILLSLGPGITVILAWSILKERLSKIQIIGIFLSIIASYFLSL